jgi:hypothetical protein
MRDGWLSVSEIISFADKPFLLNWARKLALQGLDHNRVSTLGKYAGRILHWEFQQRYGNSLDPMGKDVQEAYLDVEAVEHGGTAWAKLREYAYEKFQVCYDHDPGIFRVEFPIEDEELKVRARLDLVFNSGYLWDWKSSKHLYAESILEIGAYDYLWNRKYPDTPLVGWKIVRCCHEDDSPAEEYTLEESDVKLAGMTFASMIPAVRAYKEFEGKAKGILANSMGGGE